MNATFRKFDCTNHQIGRDDPPGGFGIIGFEHSDWFKQQLARIADYEAQLIKIKSRSKATTPGLYLFGVIAGALQKIKTKL